MTGVFFQEKAKGKGDADNAPAKRASKEISPPPEFLASRLALWDRCKAEREEWLAKQERKEIKVTLPDGKVVDAKSWETTPYDVASAISKGKCCH